MKAVPGDDEGIQVSDLYGNEAMTLIVWLPFYKILT
jgi:hypothetical protein